MATKERVLRLPMDQDEALQELAQIDGVSVTDAIRAAIDRWLEERPSDPEFQSRLDESIERNQAQLERLMRHASASRSGGEAEARGAAISAEHSEHRAHAANS
jgi:hypothetical protein